MKKVIVTRDNYEEVMFGLLEDQYPADTRNNILDQIHADTFLEFEWQQWTKAIYSESIESYKQDDAAFIESLTKEEKKKGILYYILPLSVAASIILLVGYYIGMRDNTAMPVAAIQKHKDKHNEQPAVAEAEAHRGTVQEPLKHKKSIDVLPGAGRQDTNTIIAASEPAADTLKYVAEKKEIVLTAAQQDTVKALIAMAKKQSKYKITIVESTMDDAPSYNYRYNEKRYTMADVMSRKDGISLSRFLQNPSTRIITDTESSKVTIEYVAADKSVLVLTLSN